MTSVAFCVKVLSQLTTKPQLSGELQIIKCKDIYGNLSDQVRSVKTWEKIFKIYDKKRENSK